MLVGFPVLNKLASRLWQSCSYLTLAAWAAAGMSTVLVVEVLALFWVPVQLATCQSAAGSAVRVIVSPS